MNDNNKSTNLFSVETEADAQAQSSTVEAIENNSSIYTKDIKS